VSFLHINGVVVPVKADSLEEEEITIGDLFSRSLAGVMLGSLATTKRRWSFTTTPIEAVEAEKLRAWIEGRVQTWNFPSTILSSGILSGAGVGNTYAGVLTTFITAGHILNRLTVGAGSQFYVDMRNKLYVDDGWAFAQGWSLGFWSFRTIAADGTPANAWFDYLATGAVQVLQALAPNPVGVTQYRDAVAGSHRMGNMIDVETLQAGVTGHTLLGASAPAAKDYSDLFFAPFEIPASWVSALNTFRLTNELGPAPVVKASGSWFTEAAPIRVLCRCKSTRQFNARLPGAAAHSASNRILEVVMEEQ
jgi:hypothetical protein